jgi:hypothetical protein
MRTHRSGEPDPNCADIGQPDGTNSPIWKMVWPGGKSCTIAARIISGALVNKLPGDRHGKAEDQLTLVGRARTLDLW